MALAGFVPRDRDVDARAPIVHVEAPPDVSYINWVEAGAVSPVKDQGGCGSCWTFGTTGALEGAHAATTGELYSFSEEQLINCSNAYDGWNEGC